MGEKELLSPAAGSASRMLTKTANPRSPPPQARKYTRQIVSAIGYLHRSDVVHRDLKAENLLLDNNLDIKVVDFGLSNSIAGRDFLSTQCGSPAYSAPELLGGKSYGKEVDVYSM